MTFSGDPYRVLGLKQGAPAEDVKRAYRALVKRYHPDFAGESTVARFVAIQQAYEAITGPGPARPLARPAPGAPAAPAPWPPRPPEAPRRPSSADPDRARATREAFRTRRTTGRGPDAGDGPAAASGATGAGGATGTRAAPPRGAPRPTDPPGPDEPGPSTGPRPSSTRKASLGSTSYDDATDWEPEWNGATWYGQSSGTHWTVNPREYADPRKHGPEYLARARRRAEAIARAEAARAGAQPAAEESDAGTAPTDGADPRPVAEPSPSGPAASPRSGAPPRGWRYDGVPPAARERAGSASAAAPPPFERPAPNFTSPSPAGGGATASIAAVASSIPARLLAALIGWPPIGYLGALAVGEATGCGRYSAACTPEVAVASWLVQPLVILLLLLVPTLGRLAAVGSIGLAVAAVPAAAALSASGGNRGPTGAAIALFLGILVMAYVVAVVGAASGRLPLPGWLGRRGEPA